MHWRDSHGRWCVSSAGAALRRLERQGKVCLPAGRGQRTAKRRQLVDDGASLPPLPKLPRHAGKIPGLRLRLIQGEEDPAHLLWNRLIGREHPLGRQPLVGAQLRYLVECEFGIIGAFGFGPAAFHLECRDQWIGWTQQAREQNRPRVIGLSRFLIRPGLRCLTLASQCYGLVLRQVAGNWQKRFGTKPLLVETYVDRHRHDGRSLAAANWRRIGESKRRGRDDRQRQAPKSPKDVWVYELDHRARSGLQAQSVELLAPRSVFSGPVLSEGLAEEMVGVELGDERLNRRAVQMLQARWRRPNCSFYRSFDCSGQGKGAFKLVESPRPQINLQSLLAAHQLQTARRMAAEKVILLAQDTTPLSYNRLRATKDLGPIGEGYTRGLFLHSLHAFRLDGIPLGTLWAEAWARPQNHHGPHRNEQSVEEKESGRWLRALQEAGQRARQMPQTRLVVCADRESDIYELYDQKMALPSNVDLLVRSQHDRVLTDGTRLRDSLENRPLGGRMTVTVPRTKNQPPRTAELELRWHQVQIRPPAVGLKKSWPALRIYALLACEVGAPKGVEPIDWLLLSTWPITSLKIARRHVRWYGLRWGIECWHRVLKSGCWVERRQMKSARALERALALDMIIASRVLLLNRLGKEHPDLPADLFYSPEELAVLQLKKKHLRKDLRTEGTLTVLQANILVAMLVGFWGRKSDGHPGAKLLAEGLNVLQQLVWFKRELAEASPPPPPT